MGNLWCTSSTCKACNVVYLVLGIGTRDSDCVNSADPNEMPPYVAFQLGLHCLPKYIFTGIQNE